MVLKLKYKYYIVLSLANREVKMEEIKGVIERSVGDFNRQSQNSKNVKEINKYEIKDDLFHVWVSFEQNMVNPAKGLFALTQRVIKLLEDDGRGELVDQIVTYKSFFKSVGKPKEIKNIKLETTEIKGSRNDLSLIEAHKMITDIFFDNEINSNDKDKIREEILKLLGDYKKRKAEIILL